MLINQKHLFSREECQNIIWNKTNDIIHWDMNNRKYNSNRIDYDEDTKWIFNKLKDFFEIETGLKIVKIKKRVHFHKYKKGDWFGKHNDIRDRRLYGIGVLLNDSFEGGDFKLYTPNEYTLDKETGNTYIFDVRIEHEITPILEGERYSLLWFLQKDNIKIKTNKLL